MCQKVVQNYRKRIEVWENSRRDYLNDLVLHTLCQDPPNFIIEMLFQDKKYSKRIFLLLFSKPQNG